MFQFNYLQSGLLHKCRHGLFVTRLIVECCQLGQHHYVLTHISEGVYEISAGVVCVVCGVVGVVTEDVESIN